MLRIDRCFWGHGRPGRGVTPSARSATSPSICGNEATARPGDEAQTALHVRRGLPATVWCRRFAVIGIAGVDVAHLVLVVKSPQFERSFRAIAFL